MGAYNTGTSFHTVIHQPINDVDFERVTLEVWLSDEGGTTRIYCKCLVAFNEGARKLAVCQHSPDATVTKCQSNMWPMTYERLKPSGAMTAFTISRSAIGPMAAKPNETKLRVMKIDGKI